MADVTTLRVRGEGGAEFDMDLPAEGSPRREIFDEFVAKGWIVILDGELSARAAPAAEDVPAPKPAKKAAPKRSADEDPEV